MSIQLFKIINETCTDADREECKADVYRAFEKMCEEEPSIFLATAVEFMVDRLSIPEVEWYMQTASDAKLS